MGKTTYLEETMELSAISPLPLPADGRPVNYLLMFQRKCSDEEFQELLEKTASVFETVEIGEKKTIVKGAGWAEVNIAGTDEKRVLIGVHFSGCVVLSTFKLELLKGKVFFPDDTVFGKPPFRTFLFTMEEFYGTLPRGANSDGISEERMEELLTLTSDEIKELKKPKELVYLCLHYQQQQQEQQQQEESADDEESDGENAGENAGESDEEIEECDKESDGGQESPPKKARIEEELEQSSMGSTGGAMSDSVTREAQQQQQQLERDQQQEEEEVAFEELKELWPYMEYQKAVQLLFTSVLCESGGVTVYGRSFINKNGEERTRKVPVEKIITLPRVARYHKHLMQYIIRLATVENKYREPPNYNYETDYWAKFYAKLALCKAFDTPIKGMRA